MVDNIVNDVFNGFLDFIFDVIQPFCRLCSCVLIGSRKNYILDDSESVAYSLKRTSFISSKLLRHHIINGLASAAFGAVILFFQARLLLLYQLYLRRGINVTYNVVCSLRDVKHLTQPPMSLDTYTYLGPVHAFLNRSFVQFTSIYDAQI